MSIAAIKHKEEVPFLDLKSINAKYQVEIEKAVKRVFSSGWYIKGKEVSAFESEFSTYLNLPYCIGVGNGLDALRLIFRAYVQMGKLKKGDEVLVPYNTFIATVLAIREEGLKPILLPVDMETFNIDSRQLEDYLTAKTKAIAVVHLYGQVGFDQKLLDFVKRHKLLFIEDAAQSIGAEFEGKKLGTIGDAAATSFYPGKNLGALGDGGAVMTKDPELAEIVRSLGNYGSVRKYIHLYNGVNSRLDELQAAILSVKLPHLDQDNARRRAIAHVYSLGIHNPLIQLPKRPIREFEHVWHLYVIRTRFRNQLQSYLAKQGIQTIIHYPIPIPLQGACPELVTQYQPQMNPIHDEILSLPISPVMSNTQVKWVIDTLNNFSL